MKYLMIDKLFKKRYSVLLFFLSFSFSILNGQCDPVNFISIIEVNEQVPAIPEIGNFGDGALIFNDRIYQYKNSRFNGQSGNLDVAGGLTVNIPYYLRNQSYLRLSNSAKVNSNVSTSVTADKPTYWYLLIDNRVNGPLGISKDNKTDPILGGTLQWVIDGGWVRVNTGISPKGRPDYIGVDESIGGQLEQFYSVWTLPTATTAVTVSNTGISNSNNTALVASCLSAAEPIPTMSQWGIIILSLVLLISGLLCIRLFGSSELSPIAVK